MFRKRVALGLAVSAGFLLLAWLDTALAGGPIFHILIGVIMVCTLIEVCGLAERHRDEPMRVLPIALIVCFVAWDYAVAVRDPLFAGELLRSDREVVRTFYGSNGLAAALGVWVICVAHLLTRDPRRWLRGAPATILGFLYVWFFGAHFFPVRAMGIGYVLALIAAAKVGDAGAFFVGRRWGRHQLAPRTSPSKTVEGAAGGLAASVLGSVVVSWLFALSGGLFFWVFFGLVVGVAAQLGDLVGSAVKRSAGAKDSGHLLPALGGVLDIVDSPLMAAPVAFWLLAL